MSDVTEAVGPIDPLEGIARAALAGDTRSTRQLLVELAPIVLRTARAFLGTSHPDIEDHVQETLVDVVRALPSFRFECKVSHFAVRIVIRKMTVARRRARRVIGWLDRFRQEEKHGEESAPAPGETVSPRKAALLRDMLHDLPEAQGEVMVLRVGLGYSLEEVAEATASPVNTVRSRLRLAKEALRKRIETDPRWAELAEVGT